MVAQVLRLSNPTLTRAGHRLLVVLAHHHNAKTGLCCPGHALLGRELLIGKRQVIRLVHSLEKDGWIDVVPGQGRGRLSLYRIKLPPPDVIHRKGDISRTDAGRKGDISGPEGPRKGDILGHVPITVVEHDREKTEQVDAVARAPEATSPDPDAWVMLNRTYGLHLVCGANHQPGTPCYGSPSAGDFP
jgi:hypothetical protein